MYQAQPQLEQAQPQKVEPAEAPLLAEPVEAPNAEPAEAILLAEPVEAPPAEPTEAPPTEPAEVEPVEAQNFNKSLSIKTHYMRKTNTQKKLCIKAE